MSIYKHVTYFKGNYNTCLKAYNKTSVVEFIPHPTNNYIYKAY